MLGQSIKLAAITRLAISELPFLRSFIRHHQDLGINFFCFIVTDPDFFTVISDYIAGVVDPGFYFLFCAEQNLTPNQALFAFDLSCVEGDYVVLLDADEYLHSPAGVTLAECIGASEDRSSWFFPWVLAPTDFDPLLSRLGFLGHTGKQLARRDRIAAIATPHVFRLHDEELHGPQFSFELAMPFVVVHFWSRGFLDSLLKCKYYRNFTPCKQSSLEELLAAAEGDPLPMRLRLLAALMLRRRYVCLPGHLLQSIDRGLEASLLDLPDRVIASLEVQYRGYQRRLRGQPCLAGYPSPRGIVGLAEGLPLR